MIFASFLDRNISKQCPLHHTGRDACSTVSKGKVTYIGPPTRFFLHWSSSGTCPGCVSMPKARCLSLHPLCLQTACSLQQPFYHSCSGLLLHMFSPTSPWDVFLMQSNARLWSLHPFTDNLSILLHCFLPCTSDSKICLLSSPEAFLSFHTHSWAMLMDIQSISARF